MASTKEQILAALNESPQLANGWIEWMGYDYFMPRVPSASRSAIQVAISAMVRKGELEVQRDGRSYTHVRLSRANSMAAIRQEAGSQTERMLHYLFSIANEKGVIGPDGCDIKHLQQALGFRDFHDVNKALHNLNKLGILEIRESRISSGENHRITKMRLRLERQKSWPIDLITDEELPGQTDIEVEEEDMEPVPVEAIESVRLDQESPVETVKPSEMDRDPEQERSLETKLQDAQELIQEVHTDIALEDLLLEKMPAEDFPHIWEAVSKHRARSSALINLEKAGEMELREMLAEKHEDPLAAELAKLFLRLGIYG